MALTFPSNPTVGQGHAEDGGSRPWNDKSVWERR